MKSLVASMVLTICVGLSHAIPLRLSSSLDPYGYYRAYGYGPCNGLGLCDFNRYGLPTNALDALSVATALGTDLPPYSSYPYGTARTVDVANENFVRSSSIFGPVESGTRNEVTVRPSNLFSNRYYGPFSPYNYISSPWSLYNGAAASNPFLDVGLANDALYMRR